jgi:hypothetical protein
MMMTPTQTTRKQAELKQSKRDSSFNVDTSCAKHHRQTTINLLALDSFVAVDGERLCEKQMTGKDCGG